MSVFVALLIYTGVTATGANLEAPAGTFAVGVAQSETIQDAPNKPDKPDEVEAQIAKYIELAKSGRIPVRPQAAKRLLKLGAPAAQRLLAECGADGAGLVALGPYLIEELAEFDEPKLRAILWASLADPAFPWRAPAARTLAKTATEERPELDAFFKLASDPIAPVREAAIQGLASYDAKDERSRAQLELMTRDPDDRVRRAAAAQLDAWGEPRYLLWLVRELQRDDDYFGMPLGERARFDALRILKARLGSDFGFRAEDSPQSAVNVEAYQRILATVIERAGDASVELPPMAVPRASATSAAATDAPSAKEQSNGDLIGLELRSCRTGDLFLRWNAADVLLIGTNPSCAVALSPGTSQRLSRTLLASAAKVGEPRYWGDAGCDIEQIRVRKPDGELDIFLVSKDQAAVPNLRPDALNEMLRVLVASLPNEEQGTAAWDPRAIRLRDRVREALLLIGGEYRGD